MARRDFQIFPSGMTGVDAVEAATRHVFPRHTHDQFGIGVIHRGAQKSASGRGPVEAGPGDAITVNPGEVHDGAPLGDHGRSWRMLYFDPGVIAAAVADMSEGGAREFEFHDPVIRDSRIAGRFRALYAAITKGEAGTLQREEMIFILLAALRPRPAGEALPAVISQAREMIAADPAYPVTLAELARHCGLSKFQLLRGFCKATGLTPHAFLVQRRVALARRLITARMPLAEAALTAGFADQSHMTRLFVRTYGLSPGLYADAAR
ncbi:MAG TPA: AraC family transcriptional regulator [Nordella sp.]|nr:AraC family transcriptional regulator [Nordella sp.]